MPDPSVHADNKPVDTVFLQGAAGADRAPLRSVPMRFLMCDEIGSTDEARITIVVHQESDKLHMSATCRGRFDSIYAAMPAERLFSTALPRLVEELRSQLQVSSGSTTTE